MDEKAQADLIRRLRETFAAIDTLVRDLDEDALLKRPGEGRWSVQEILGHLRDVERSRYRSRLKLLRTEKWPFFPKWDGVRAAERGGYQELDSRELLESWREIREETIAAIAATPAADWAREGSHEVRGRESFEDIVRSMAEHDVAHLGQILRNLADLRAPRGDVRAPRGDVP